MIAVSILTFIIFLFTSYMLSNDDFVFLRKNISTEQIFNTIFVGLIVAVLTARIGYIAFHPSTLFLNPLVFFALPYFPGLSLIGAIIGSFAFIIFSYFNKKNPTERILDMFTIAFFISWSCYSFFTGLFHLILRSQQVVVDLLIFLITLCISVIWSIRFKAGKWQDGILFYLGGFFFSVLTGIIYVLTSLFAHHFTFQLEQVISAVIGLVCFTFFLRKLFIRKRALRK